MLKKLSKNKFFLNLFANFVYAALYFVKTTSNWKGINEAVIQNEIKNNKSLIVLIWHNQLMGSTFSWKFKPKLRPIATSHRDGQLSILVQRKFGLDPLLRDKNKPTTLIKNISLASKNGDCIYITPDAPHGPVYQINTNIFKLASKFKMKVVFLTFKTNKFFQLNNWDKLKIPMPFSKGIFYWGEKVIDPTDYIEEKKFNQDLINELNNNMKIINDYI
jgi:lysophospholipid acyltransferase (LPLAT)-like uncharacterized protein